MLVNLIVIVIDILLGLEMLPSNINLYIDDNKVYYMVRKSEVNKVCYYTNMDINMSYINREIGKL